MNTKNNKRRQETRQKIEQAFLALLQKKELQRITVSELCKAVGINRSTFYTNYLDIYDLADTIKAQLETQVAALYAENNERGKRGHDYLRLFRHIYDNQVLYSTYFRLGYDARYEITFYDKTMAEQRFGNRFVEYHLEFFMQGFNGIVKKWLAGGCRETPEEMMEILESEYRGRTDLW